MSLNTCARLLSGVFILVLLSACASTPQTLLLEKSPPGNIKTRVELDQVPFFPQRDYQCGPAALATVLDYRGIEVTPSDLTDKVYIPQRKGSLQIEMIATARSYGLLSYQIDPRLSVMLQEINDGNPVLVFQNLSLKFWPQWHYAVAIGYDLNKAELILRSGTHSRHSISFATFERTWHRASYWAYVFMQPGKIPSTANPVTYAQSCHDLQQAGLVDHALIAFRQGKNEWPDNSIALMALGNAEFSVGNFVHAIDAFQREIGIRPKNASAWNNLSYALAANNCKEQAFRAITCASRISPNDTNIQQSLLEIYQMPISNKGQCEDIICPVN